METTALDAEGLRALAIMLGIDVESPTAQQHISNFERIFSHLRSFPDEFLNDVEPAYVAPIRKPRREGSR